MSTTTKKPWTADELNRLPDDWRYEIDEGELLIMSPGGRRHSRIVGNTFVVLYQFVRERRLGEVLTGELGVLLQRDPQILRAVDVAFFSAERVKEMGTEETFPTVPPDLAVEVHDPSKPDLRRKIDQYLAAGVRAVWVLDPAIRAVTRYAPGEAPRTFDDTLVEPILPGFSCRVADLFDGPK